MLRLALIVSLVTACGGKPQYIRYRSFSAAAAMGPMAEVFAARLAETSAILLGSPEILLQPLTGVPVVPPQFKGDILAAVEAGAADGGYDAAYIPGSDINKVWGFIYNSGIPFGPNWEQFIGFLYGTSSSTQQSGLTLLQRLLDASGRNVVVIPIVGGSEQLSGYFKEPLDTAGNKQGIGLAGLCARKWKLRYLPPAENVLVVACDTLVAEAKIEKRNLSFVQAVPGGGSLIEAVKAGKLDGFEYATPLDDVSQLFMGQSNPGNTGVGYVHVNGWHQPFLITYMAINKHVWNTLSTPQRRIICLVARDNLLWSYAESLSKQGAALRQILATNGMVLSRWPDADQERLREATSKFIDEHGRDISLSPKDRDDYREIMEVLRAYIEENEHYWNVRSTTRPIRF